MLNATCSTWLWTFIQLCLHLLYDLCNQLVACVSFQGRKKEEDNEAEQRSVKPGGVHEFRGLAGVSDWRWIAYYPTRVQAQTNSFIFTSRFFHLRGDASSCLTCASLLGTLADVLSFSEARAQSLVNHKAEQFLSFNQRQLSRIYPSAYRIDSSNFNPQFYWNVGCQLGETVGAGSLLCPF